MGPLMKLIGGMVGRRGQWQEFDRRSNANRQGIATSDLNYAETLGGDSFFHPDFQISSSNLRFELGMFRTLTEVNTPKNMI